MARGRVGHGYLLTGPRGVGKTTAARILAMALNCPNRDPSGDPCGECENCVRIWTGAANLDVVEIDCRAHATRTWTSTAFAANGDAVAALSFAEPAPAWERHQGESMGALVARHACAILQARG